MYWIVLANSNQYRIYHYKNEDGHLELIKEEFHPESKEKTAELVSDKPGRYHVSVTGGSGAYSPNTDPKEVEIEHFLRELAKELDSGRVNKQYEKIILLAPAKVNGILFKHLDKNTQRLVLDHIKKEYTFFAEHELKKFLHENWKELVRE